MKKLFPILLACFCGLLLSQTTIAQVQVELKIRALGSDVHLDWAAQDQADVAAFIIHRSLDGRYFDLVVEQPGSGQYQDEYQHVDMNLPNGEYAYRVQLLFNDGSQKLVGYEIVSVNQRPEFDETSVFPDEIRANPINQ